jgi:16S rRNA (cytidine1402-2'-O)-methyltransferase
VVETPKSARAFINRWCRRIPLPLSTSANPARTRLIFLMARPHAAMPSASCPTAAPASPIRAPHSLQLHAASIRVVPLVGPSGDLLALNTGMNGQTFEHLGGQREVWRQTAEVRVVVARHQRLDEIEDLRDRRSVDRNEAMAGAIIAQCRPATHLCIAADLTLPTEFVACRPVSGWRRAPPPSLDKRPALFLLGRG